MSRMCGACQRKRKRDSKLFRLQYLSDLLLINILIHFLRVKNGKCFFIDCQSKKNRIKEKFFFRFESFFIKSCAQTKRNVALRLFLGKKYLRRLVKEEKSICSSLFSHRLVKHQRVRRAIFVVQRKNIVSARLRKRICSNERIVKEKNRRDLFFFLFGMLMYRIVEKYRPNDERQSRLNDANVERLVSFSRSKRCRTMFFLFFYFFKKIIWKCSVFLDENFRRIVVCEMKMVKMRPVRLIVSNKF